MKCAVLGLLLLVGVASAGRGFGPGDGDFSEWHMRSDFSILFMALHNALDFGYKYYCTCHCLRL